ncbi:MAG: OmpA family protein [Bacteroidota bacterium]|nr:OmpA family protein [Bacteroidota bacterium]
MNQNRNLYFSLALMGAVTFSGCTLQKMVKRGKNQQITVTPNPLEVHADTVNFSLAATLPAKTLRKGKIYTVNTFYEFGGEELPLEGVEFAAENFKGNDQPNQKKDYSFAYRPEMQDGDLTVQGVASNPKNQKSRSSARMKVADGIITTSKMVKDVNYAAYADHGYITGEELEPTNVEFYFDQGSSQLRTSETRSDRGSFLRNFIADKNVTKTVTITGTHSPEGTERVNKNLAADRASAIQKYYRDQMRRYDYKGAADSINFVAKPVVEDWTELKEMLQGYDKLNQEQKNEVLSIINGQGDFAEKENRVSRLPYYRTTLFKDIYPQLRTAKTEILTVKEKKPDSEIAVLSRQIATGAVSADTLSNEELAYSATLTPSLAERENIYKAAVKKQDSWQAHSNLAATYLEMAQGSDSEEDRRKHIENAKTQLEIASKQKETAEVLSNLAVVQMMDGNASKAMSTINRAAQLESSETTGRGIAGVKGALEIRSAQYDKAIQTLSRAEQTPLNLYNKGLAQLLKKDFQNASTTFNEVVKMNNPLIHAEAHYLLAVTSARMKNENQVTDNLKKAVTANPDLKEKALKDAEFLQYSESESFRSSLR